MADRPTNEFSVKVTGVPAGTSSKELRGVFEDAGFEGITDVYLPPRFAKFEYGFVRFGNEREAEDAAAMMGLEVRGSPLKCEMSTREKRQCPVMAMEPSRPDFGRNGPRMGGPGNASVFPAGASFRTAPAPAMMSRAVPKTNEASVWVGSLPNGTTADELREVAESRGVVDTTDVYVPPGNRGFGFLRFAERRDAEEAARRCEGMRIGDHVLELKLSFAEKARAGPPVQVAEPLTPFNRAMGGVQVTPKTNEASVWVGSLPAGTTAADLRNFAESHGILDMTDVYVPPGDRGFGFLRFAERREAEAAMRACEGLSIGDNELAFKLSIAEKAKIGPAMLVQEPSMPCNTLNARPVLNDMPFGRDRDRDRDVRDRARGPIMKEAIEVSVKVSNLPPQLGLEGLREALAYEGIDTMTDVYIPRGRSFGFVRFRSLGEAQSCLHLDGIRLGDNNVVIELADGEKKSSSEMAAPLNDDRDGGYFRGDVRDRGYSRGDDFGTQGSPSFGPVSRGVRSEEVSLKVSNIPPGCAPHQISAAFADRGVDFMTDCYIPRGAAYAFVRFASAAEGRYVLNKDVWMGDHQLEIQLAQGTKRSSDEMHGRDLVRENLAPPLKIMRECHAPTDVPDNPEVSADTPSVRVSRLSLGTSSEELHAAFREAGCRGDITDVYVPKGDRGFGFVRFSSMADAQDASRLSVLVRGQPAEVDLSVGNRKTKPTVGGPGVPGPRGGMSDRNVPLYGPARGAPRGDYAGARFVPNTVGPYSRHVQQDLRPMQQDYSRGPVRGIVPMINSLNSRSGPMQTARAGTGRRFDFG